MPKGKIATEGSPCVNCPGRHQGLCAALPEAVRTRLALLARQSEYPADHVFWDDGTEPDFIAILRHGRLRLQHVTVDGRRRILALAAPGDIVGEATEARACYGLEAVTPVGLCRFERAAFNQAVAQEPELRLAVYRQFGERLDTIRRMTWLLGALTPEERLCDFLLRAALQVPGQPLADGSGLVSLDFPRRDLADLLATTPETISRMLHRLDGRGLIEIRDPRQFRIPDLSQLARAAGLEPKDLSPGAVDMPTRLSA